MKFEVEHEEAYTLLTLKSERLDSKISPDLKSQIILFTNSSDNSHLILDLESVEFADSSGLSALLMAHRLYRDTDRDLILCNLSDRVSKLLEISQLNSVFTVVENRDAALAHISENEN